MFDMGSPDDEVGRTADEGPLHRVRISRAFYMGRYEVTQEQWEKVMGKNPSAFKGPKNPVENVSWDECQEFLKRLNQRTPHPNPLPEGEGVSSVPSPTGRGMKGEGTFRLPTEAEWEWACRAGTRTRFCSGDADAGLGEYAWFDANSGNTTHPVGKKQPNAWGLYDMHGNVWEWCEDWYDKYPKGWRPNADPTGPATGSRRVWRGGSWFGNPENCRSSYRVRNVPAFGVAGRGLRVVAVCEGH
jgi:formylglycine-generating enzyme required for sulfatase activity